MKTLYTIGIDFGTSNSCVCYASYNLRDDGIVDAIPVKRPEALSLQHADTIPTVVYLGNGDSEPALYGEIAEERAVFYPDLTRAGFKLDLGQPTAEGAEAFVLTKQFLSYLRTKVAEYVPLDQGSDSYQVETFVGHPVQWTADQREETLRATQEAGFPNVSIEGESMAAVYCHLCETGSSVLRDAGSTVLMIDMGGGTTDFAFLKLSNDPKVPPVSIPVDPALSAEPWGDNRRSYGGRDLDRLLLQHFLTEWGFRDQPKGYDLLMRETRRFKERFSTNIDNGVDVYQSAWLVEGQQKVVRLDRETFDLLTADYRAYFPKLVDAALELGGFKAEDVSAIILTGGHSRWFFVESALKQRFPQIRKENHTLLRHNHPEQSVARGLCYKRMILAQGGEASAPRRRATHSIWVGVAPEAASPLTAMSAEAGQAGGESNAAPLLVMPQGQLLPYKPKTPVTFSVSRLALDDKEPILALRLYSGIQTGERVALLDRTARFQRGLFEDLVKRIARHLPWSTQADEDRFLIDVFCMVDENEIISGKVVITRYWREQMRAVQTQPLRIDPKRQSVTLGSPTPPTVALASA